MRLCVHKVICITTWVNGVVPWTKSTINFLTCGSSHLLFFSVWFQLKTPPHRVFRWGNEYQQQQIITAENLNYHHVLCHHATLNNSPVDLHDSICCVYKRSVKWVNRKRDMRDRNQAKLDSHMSEPAVNDSNPSCQTQRLSPWQYLMNVVGKSTNLYIRELYRVCTPTVKPDCNLYCKKEKSVTLPQGSDLWHRPFRGKANTSKHNFLLYYSCLFWPVST